MCRFEEGLLLLLLLMEKDVLRFWSCCCCCLLWLRFGFFDERGLVVVGVVVLVRLLRFGSVCVMFWMFMLD